MVILRPCRFLEVRDNAETLEAKARVVVFCMLLAVLASVVHAGHGPQDFLVALTTPCPRRHKDTVLLRKDDDRNVIFYEMGGKGRLHNVYDGSNKP